MFNQYIAKCQHQPRWKRLFSKDANGVSPCQRGGHQMCCDPQTGSIYLLGGWDGNKDLADFWVYNSSDDRWCRISNDTKQFDNFFYINI